MAELEILINAEDHASDTIESVGQTLGGLGDAGADATNGLADLSTGLGDIANSADEAAGGLEDVTGSLGDVSDSFDQAGDAGGDYGDGLGDVMDISGGFGKASKLLGGELKMLSQAFDFAEENATRLGRADVADKIAEMKEKVSSFKDVLLELPLPLINFPGVESRNFLDWMGDAAQGLTNIINTAGAVSTQFQLMTGQITREEAITAINDLTGETERLAAAAQAVADANEAASNKAAAGRWEGLAEMYGELTATSTLAAAAIASTGEANAAAAERSSAAQAAAQQSLDDRVTGFYALATALKDTTAAELAQTEMKALDELLAAGTITQGEYKEATENIGLAFGIFTPQSLALAEATDMLTNLYGAGKITADELTTATGNLAAAAADGKVDLDELGISINAGVTPAFAAANDKAGEFEGVLNRLDGRTVTQNVVTNYSSNGTPTYGSEGYEHGNGYADGGQYSGGPMLVGEQGPEYLFPSNGGYVMNNGDSNDLLSTLKQIAQNTQGGGRGNTTQNYFYGAGGDMEAGQARALAGAY